MDYSLFFIVVFGLFAIKECCIRCVRARSDIHNLISHTIIGSIGHCAQSFLNSIISVVLALVACLLASRWSFQIGYVCVRAHNAENCRYVNLEHQRKMFEAILREIRHRNEANYRDHAQLSPWKTPIFQIIELIFRKCNRALNSLLIDNLTDLKWQRRRTKRALLYLIEISIKYR